MRSEAEVHRAHELYAFLGEQLAKRPSCAGLVLHVAQLQVLCWTLEHNDTFSEELRLIEDIAIHHGLTFPPIEAPRPIATARRSWFKTVWAYLVYIASTVLMGQGARAMFEPLKLSPWGFAVIAVAIAAGIMLPVQ